MFYTETEVMEFVKENDVKFIRLAFCDIFGVQKNIAIMPSELQRAFQEGFPFDATAVPGLESADDDLLLVPDPSTFSILPWRPDTGRVIRLSCNLFNRDMTPFELDSRYLLKQATAAARKAGVTCNMGVNCEFYLFRTDENGNPTETPLDNAGYFDIAPEDKGENIRREICLSLESMGICPESSHHEEGPGQNEIDFKYSDPLSSADNVTAFKVAVTTLAARNGLYASFAPKPIPDKNGNGFHINISPDMFQPEEGYFEHFMAGIMNRINEITLFLNPGKKLTIGYQNRQRQEMRTLKKYCDDGVLGDIYFGKAIALRRRAVPTWGVFMNEEEQGGGPLIDIGTHSLDLTLWMMNNYEVESVLGNVHYQLGKQANCANAWGSWDPATYTVEDSAFGLIKMKNGATIILESSWAINMVNTPEATCMLAGSKAGADFCDGLRINGEEYSKLYVKKVEMASSGVDFFAGTTDNDPAATEAQQWINAVLNDTDPTVLPEQALVVSEILEAIYESSKTGKAIYF